MTLYGNDESGSLSFTLRCDSITKKKYNKICFIKIKSMSLLCLIFLSISYLSHTYVIMKKNSYEIYLFNQMRNKDKNYIYFLKLINYLF